MGVRSLLTDSSLFVEHFNVDGQWGDAASGETLDVENPTTGSVIGRVPLREDS